MSSFVCIATDIWTSASTSSFLTVTAHFLNEDYALKCYVLVTLELTANHTGGYLATVLKDVFEKWGIMSKLVAVITDGAPNIKSVVNILGVAHLPCIAHLLNLVVQHALTNCCM